MAATTVVRDTYLQLLTPYLSGSGNNGDGSERRTQSNSAPASSKSGFGRCPECPKNYEVLLVGPNATKEEIKTAYRDLAKINHSDHLQSSEDRVRRKAEESLKRINLAYDHISSHWKERVGKSA
jgi:DnaJ-domain-containing protein 1